MAQTERENIRRRQAEGIAAARARGVHLGRPVESVPEGLGALYDNWINGRIKAREAGAVLDRSTAGFYRLCRKYEAMA